MSNGKAVDRQRYTEVTVGLGLVLIPAICLFFGSETLSSHPMVGLPVLAIFGIMILFGAMALTSTLFARLKLGNPAEPLALPAGSIRAAIALSLIVLFAIISIMLFQSLTEPYRLEKISEQDKSNLIKDFPNRILAVRVVSCPATSGASPGAGAPEKTCYDVQLAPAAGQEATDIAKQLLVLVGTLMTSVTSYYFAARTAKPTTSGEGTKPDEVIASTDSTPADQKSPHTHTDGDVLDGCNVPITAADATHDADLPRATGGVAS